MTVSLQRIVNSDLIKKFQGVASRGRSVADSMKGGGGGEAVQVGLRYGAQTYARALQGLNAVGGFINLSQARLEKLDQLTDKLIGIASEAARPGTQKQEAQRLEFQFRRVAAEFGQIVQSAKMNNREYLTVDGLGELFAIVGLDREKSDEIAALFRQFVTAGEDNALASDTIERKQDVRVPASIFRPAGAQGGVRYEPRQVSQAAAANVIEHGLIASGVSVYQSGGAVVIVPSADGAAATEVHAGQPVQIKGITAGGDLLVQSKADPLGFNPAQADNLFLLNAAGDFVRQFTNNSSSSVTFGEAAVAADGRSVLCEQLTSGEQPRAELLLGKAAASSGDPAGVEFATVAADTGGAGFGSLSISSDGGYLTYRSNDPLQNSFIVKDTATLTTDAFIAADETIITGSFIGQARLALVRDGDGDAQGDTISAVRLGAASYQEIRSGIAIDQFTAVAAPDGSGSLAYSSCNPADEDDVYLLRDDGTELARYDADPALDRIAGLSLAYTAAGQPEVGIYGTLSGVAGRHDDQLYRLQVGLTAESGSSAGGIVRQAERIFDGSRQLTNKAEAYVIAAELKVLKEQIASNLKVLDQARELVVGNMKLVRVTGLALLDISQRIKNESEAEVVAQQLRDKIRADAHTALRHAENLESIAVAALVLDDASFAVANKSE